MSRVYLEKIGFIRDPEEDFSDDGSRFYCYKIPGCKVRISKTTYRGQIYLHGRIDGNLDYEEYSKLPHFADMDKLNGVSLDSITKQDVEDFYRACMLYNKEYTEAEKNIVYPEVEEIQAHYEAELNKRKAELQDVKDKCTVEKLLNMNEYHLKWFRNSYTRLKQATETNCSSREWAEKHYGSAYSRSYIKNNSGLQDSYSYKECLEYLKGVAA